MRAAASRSGGPQACPAGCARHSVRGDCINIRSKPLFRTLRRIPHSDCLTAPAAGYRTEWSGALDNVGTNGGYRSSVSTDAKAGFLEFNASFLNPLNSGIRAVGRSVRCVQASTRKLPGEGADVAAKNAETHPDPRAAPCAGEEKDLEIRIILSTFVHNATTGFWPSGPGFLFFYVYTEAGNPARENSSEERRL